MGETLKAAAWIGFEVNQGLYDQELLTDWTNYSL